MTGSVFPKNCNTFIRYEDVDIKNGIAIINKEGINHAQNVHKKGKDGEQISELKKCHPDRSGGTCLLHRVDAALLSKLTTCSCVCFRGSFR